MTNKDNLQKELLEKIKPGTKPSDLKKQKGNISKKTDEQSPLGFNKPDEGYSSDEGKNFADKADNQKIDNSKKNNFVDSEKKFLDQITSLKKLLQTYKDFKEADLKIKEKYKEEIKELTQELEKTKKRLRESFEERSLMNKTIQELKSKGGNKENVKQEQFTCYHCKNSQPLPLLVLELPEGKLCQPCWTILRKKTKENIKGQNPPTPQLFTCVVCEIEKTETPLYKKVEMSYKPHLIKGKEYPVCSTCSPHIKEYNEDENKKFSIGED